MFGFLICGSPGTGKSSHTQEILDNAGITKKYVLIDPDKIDARTHEERSSSAMNTVLECIKKGKSFVYIATCAATRDTMDLLSRIKAKKYTTVVAISYTKLTTALERIADRKDQPTPEDVTRDLYAFFASKAERFMKMKDLDELYLYNNETQFNLLLKMKNKHVACSGGDFYFDISKYCTTF
jgi:predicted ABC-type ATPase